MNEFDPWGRLATYNGERSRGIVHTDEWVALMQQEQEAFNRQQKIQFGLDPDKEISPGEIVFTPSEIIRELDRRMWLRRIPWWKRRRYA